MNTTQTTLTTLKVLGTMLMRREASITRFLEDMVSELHEFGFDILRYSLAAVWYLVKADWYHYKTEFQTLAQPDEVQTFEEPTTEVYALDTTTYLARCQRYNIQPVSLTPQQQVQWDDMTTVAALTTLAVNAINERVEKAPYVKVLDRTYSMMTISGCNAALSSLLE